MPPHDASQSPFLSAIKLHPQFLRPHSAQNRKPMFKNLVPQLHRQAPNKRSFLYPYFSQAPHPPVAEHDTSAVEHNPYSRIHQEQSNDLAMPGPVYSQASRGKLYLVLQDVGRRQEASPRRVIDGTDGYLTAASSFWNPKIAF